MPAIRCPACDKIYQVDPSLAGKTIRCPNGHLLAVPADLKPKTATHESTVTSAPPSSQSTRKPTPATRSTPPPSKPPSVVRKGSSLDIPREPTQPAPSLASSPSRRPTGVIIAVVCIGVLGLLFSGIGVGMLIVFRSLDKRSGSPEKVAEGTAPALHAPESTGPVLVHPPNGSQAERVEPGAAPSPPISQQRDAEPMTPAQASPSPSPERTASASSPTEEKQYLRTIDRLDRTRLDVRSQPPKPDEWPAAVWDGHTNHVRCVAFSDDGQFVISVSGDYDRRVPRPPDNSIRVWDARRGTQLHKAEGFREALDSLSLSRGGRFALFSHGDYYDGDKYVRAKDYNIYMWDIEAKRIVGADVDLKAATDGALKDAKAQPRFTGMDLSIFTTAISPDCSKVFAGGADKKVILWDTLSTKSIIEGPTRRIKGSFEGIRAARFSPDGQYVVLASCDDTLRVHKVETGGIVVPPLESHLDIIWALDVDQTKAGALRAISGGGSRQVVTEKDEDIHFEPGARDYDIRLWDLLEGKVIRLFKGHTDDVYGLAFCPDGRHFISGGRDEIVRLWDLDSGKPLRELGRHEGPVNSVAVAPDGRSCVSGGYDCKVRFWRLPTTKDLSEALDKSSVADLAKAVNDMDVIGIGAVEELPRLVKDLGHKDAAIRQACGRVLTQLVELSRPAEPPFATLPVPDLVKVLENDCPAVLKVHVVRGLGNIGPDARDAVPVLVKFAEGKDDPRLLASLVEAFGKIGVNSPEVSALVRSGLAHKDAALRQQTLLALSRLGATALPLDVLLERMHKDTDKNVLASAEKIFQEKAGAITREDVPALRKGLTGPQSKVCIACAEAVLTLGTGATAAVPELVALLKRPEQDVQLAALRALGAVSGSDKTALPSVIKLIDAKDDLRTAVQAIVALGKIDPNHRVLAESGFPLLMDLLVDREESIRMLAEGALGQLGAKAVPSLVQRLHDENVNRRRTAADALGTIGPAAERAISDLDKVLVEDDKTAVRRAAAYALGHIGAKALPTLVARLAHTDDTVRMLAAVGLGEMGPPAAEAIPELRKLLSDNRRTVSGAAKTALAKIDPDWMEKIKR
jgi:WD40 repeat protein/HEAT repeat protein